MSERSGQSAEGGGAGAARAAGLERRRFELADDTGFDEVPARYRRFYRRWRGPGDALAENEVLCPVCKVVIRSARELRDGDRLYCMACMTRLRLSAATDGRLDALVEYE